MGLPGRTIIAVILIAGALAANGSGAVRVVARIDNSEPVYTGTPFVYQIIIDGDNKPGQVDLVPISHLKPRSAGNTDLSRTIIQTINNKTTRTVSKQLAMNFRLTASEPGRLRIPSLTVTIDGMKYKTNPVSVNVLEPGTTDKLEIEQSLSETRCYVGQPVQLTVVLYFAAEIKDPQFSFPILQDERFTFVNPDVTDPQIKEVDLGLGTTVMVGQYRTVRNGKNYNAVKIDKIIIPQQPGAFGVGPASVTTDVAVGIARSRDPFDDFGIFGSRKKYERFRVQSRPLQLNVLALPEQGKPEEFYGLIGKYDIAASSSAQKVNVGDPITLRIEVSGSFLEPVRWPRLSDIPAMAQNFKLPDQTASPSIENGKKVFTQTIRANNDKVTEIPAIPLAFFDPEAGEYTVATSEPIKLDVAPTKVLTQADLQGRDFAPVNKRVEAIKKGLAANYEDLASLEDQSFSLTAAVANPAFAAVWSIPLLGLFVSVVARLVTRSSPQKRMARQRRKAYSRAAAQINKARKAQADRHELLAAAMKHYIAERFDRVKGSLTAGDCRDIIVEQTGDDDSAAKFEQILETCEAARYASAQLQTQTADPARIVELLRTIDRKSKR